MALPPLVEPVAALDDGERSRTARHARLAGFGEVGQRRLAAARIAVVGAGGLGSPVVLALAAAGVGELVVIDDDVVDHSNLQRQLLHRLSDVGAPKVDSAVRAAADLSPTTVVRPVRERLTRENARELLAGAHLVIDGSDTFDTREAVASACETLALPLVWGTVQGFDAQVTVFWSRPPEGAEPVVLGDLYPPGSVGDVPSCADVGVLGALCVQVGGILAAEAVKLVAGIGEPLLGRVLVLDGLRARQYEVPLRAATESRPAPTHTDPMAGDVVPDDPPSADALPADPVPHVSIDASADAVLIDVREVDEVAAGMIPGSRHVPLAEVLADPSALVGVGRVVVVCQAGTRARRAAEALRAVGVDAAVLTGGIEAWSAAAAPVGA